MYAIKNTLFNFDTPIIMGILNVTPDSFFDGGQFNSDISILKQTEKMLTSGAAIIDVGGFSTRPKATFIDTETEFERAINAVRWVYKEFPEALISIDTFRSEIAKAALAEGACIVNDISGGNFDDAMFKTVLETGAHYILMHSRGTFENMMHETNYNNLVTDVLDELVVKINFFREANHDRLIIDPGLGFSKTADQNYELLKNLAVFKLFDYPLLIGLSRKSMVWKTLGVTPSEALNGTSVLNFYALQQGAHILRVHDVLEAKQTIALFKKIYYAF